LIIQPVLTYRTTIHGSYIYSSIKFNDFSMTFPKHIMTFLELHWDLKPPFLKLHTCSDLRSQQAWSCKKGVWGFQPKNIWEKFVQFGGIKNLTLCTYVCTFMIIKDVAIINHQINIFLMTFTDFCHFSRPISNSITFKSRVKFNDFSSCVWTLTIDTMTHLARWFTLLFVFQNKM